MIKSRQATGLFALALLLAVLSAGQLYADQAAWVSRQQAEKAAGLIKPGEQVRFFCEPCGEKTWRTSAVYTVSAAFTKSGSYWELVLNGRGVDMAYTFIRRNGRWVNLAMHLGIEVSSVSHFLAD